MTKPAEKKRLLTGALAVCLLLLMITESEAASAGIKEGLSLCAHTVIPALFPFLVLSSLLTASGLVRPLGRLLSPLTRRLLGLGEEGASALLLGLFCGFPVGASVSRSLYLRGEITREEFSTLLPLANNPSSAFLIGGVGLSLFSSRAFGRTLYISTLLSALLTSIFLFRFRKKRKAKADEARKQEPLSEPLPTVSFPEAVAASARQMMTVCAFVVFFSALLSCLDEIFGSLLLSPSLRALICSLLELSSGMSEASLLPSLSAMLLCAFGAGWSGLSVHLQLRALTSDCPAPYGLYLLFKLLQGLLNLLLLRLFLFLFPFSLSPSLPAAVPPLTPFSAVSLGLFGAGIIFSFRKPKKSLK